jgi:class 3 adenylate cyclase
VAGAVLVIFEPAHGEVVARVCRKADDGRMGGAGVETVTILITDLVGSTQLESRVGPIVAEELWEEHFGLLRDAVGEAGAVQQLFERRHGRAPRSAVGDTGLTATANNGALPPRFDGRVASLNADIDAVAHGQRVSE